MPMSKRTYEEVARAIRVTRSRLDSDTSGTEAIDMVVDDLATMFAEDSDKFQPERFVEACE